MIGLLLSALIVASTELYIWLLLFNARWFVLIPVALTILLWRIQKQTPASLGLSKSAFFRSFSQWRFFWLATVLLFLFLGRHILQDPHVLIRGVIYFVWCSLQQLLYQSVVCKVLRENIAIQLTAALASGFLFAALHLPNPVLVPTTFIWGVYSCLIFVTCRSIFALALLQVMLSSMVMWLTPYQWHHGFRTGPSYYAVKK